MLPTGGPANKEDLTSVPSPTIVPSPTAASNAEPEPERLLTLEGVHSDRIWGILLFPDGTKLVSSSNDERGVLWDLQTGEPACQMAGARGFDFVLSPNGEEVAGESSEGIGVWEKENCTLKRSLDLIPNEDGTYNQRPGS